MGFNRYPLYIRLNSHKLKKWRDYQSHGAVVLGAHIIIDILSKELLRNLLAIDERMTNFCPIASFN